MKKKYLNTLPYRRRRESALQRLVNDIVHDPKGDRIFTGMKVDSFKETKIKLASKAIVRLRNDDSDIRRKLHNANKATRKFIDLTEEHEAIILQIRSLEKELSRLQSHDVPITESKDALAWRKARLKKKFSEVQTLCQRLNKDIPKELHGFETLGQTV